MTTRRATGASPRDVKRGQITYDDQCGHVCTCTLMLSTPLAYEAQRPLYSPTVRVAPDVEPTESGSYWYVCMRCGAGGWSGA